jgi:hypothetical protein
LIPSLALGIPYRFKPPKVSLGHLANATLLHKRPDKISQLRK